MNKFNLGQKVQVIDKGQFYLAYKPMAIHMDVLDTWENGTRSVDGGFHTIIAVSIDFVFKEDIIYAISDGTNSYLINELGLAPEYLPCPFCNSDKIEIFHTEYTGDSYNPHHTIECTNCPATMTHYSETIDELRLLWNTRNG